MSTIQVPVSDLLITVKSREVQRGMLAEMHGDRPGMERHFLAAAHLELVLANDYEAARQNELALRSRLSAASCFYRGGNRDQGHQLLEELVQDDPAAAAEVRQGMAELEQQYPG
jgi:hypothetical protein